MTFTLCLSLESTMPRTKQTPMKNKSSVLKTKAYISTDSEHHHKKKLSVVVSGTDDHHESSLSMKGSDIGVIGKMIRKKRRFRPGTVALREIRQYQKSTDTQIPKSAFQRLVREIALNYRSDIRFQKSALEALQNAAEPFLVELLDTSNLCALHAHRVTVQKADVNLARYITSKA